MSKKKPKIADNRTLLVLGAGASIGAAMYPIESSWRKTMARMPSGGNFFHDLFFQPKTDIRDDQYLNLLGLTCEGVNDLIVRAWAMKNNMKHFDPEEWRQINIEDVFTFLDIGDRMYSAGTGYQRGFRACKGELRAFITLLLSIRSDGMHCERLMKILFELEPTDSIISFNWDTIVDFTIERTRLPLYSAYVELMNSPHPRVSEFINRGVLLKLHGSLNWFVCPNPKCAMHAKIRLGVHNGKLLRFLEMHKCPVCGNDRGEAFIVPPTSQKFIGRGTILHKLWLLAREQLQYCRRIVFIGYSFPVTDFYSEWLFRQIYFLEGPPPDIFVVNPDIMKKRSPVAERYEKIFRGCTMQRFATLKEFANKAGALLRTRGHEPTTAST